MHTKHCMHIAKSPRAVLKVLHAFKEMLKQQDYRDIAVADIAYKADVGRTTFYRYFKRKLDILIALHQNIFEDIFADLQSAEDWLSTNTPPSLEKLLITFSRNSMFRRSMSFRLGSDLDAATKQLQTKLVQHIENKLVNTFNTDEFIIPSHTLAHSIAALYLSQIQQLIASPHPCPTQQAKYLHLLTRGIILAALTKRNVYLNQ
ncbi:TetR family transcriptional regulator [Shewanella baltica]|uniref:Transcriptional regulator, TetR family n=2 Tax=Shewanellaceae TaxID=267890 RepID=A9L676_SHEB9|nr:MULTISPECIES: TetR/AcrR family transcriptional regulator [Shewanella]ABX51341.1 transcriptional regulator, TetR family [Shewanella baltica OS195]ADT96343.1 regulatory protein TetR [Shewanella baltica OS678]EHC07179.1 regulatory protein TetR [Shewanella baltica OS625]KZK65717.1 TetR family transcriptional regulator [Shewanella baltica]